MKKPNTYRLLVLSIIISLSLATILPAFAHLEPDLHSFWATTIPTIDGSLGLGEWTDAATRDFTLEMRSRTDGTLQNTLDGRLYVKNDWTDLYFAVQIFNDDYEAQDFANRWNGLCVLFEDNHNGVVEAGENGMGVTSWTGSPFYSNNDLYYTGSYWDADVNAGQTDDGSLAWTHTNPVQGNIGDWTFEMTIPLVGPDGESYDFDITQTDLPETVGFKIWFQEPGKGTDGVYPDDPAIDINLNEIDNGGTFGTLIIHPLYTLTIETTAGGTTNPAPGEYQYPYGTVVSVQALPNAGWMLDHWELDTINVGSTNPYPVTMDQNHTIKAVFTPIAVVGGISAQAVRAPLAPLITCYGIVFVVFGVMVRVTKRKRD